MKAWFVSDIHIGDGEDPRLLRFEDFLRARLSDGTTHLFLVGDIFDLWVGGHDFFRLRYKNTVSLISNLKRHGVEIIYFEGNHDLHLQTFWADELGCRVAIGPEYFDLGKFRVRVEHGDEMNPDDRGYLLLRAILRSQLMESIIRFLPGSIIQAIGNKMSRSSRKWTSNAVNARNTNSIVQLIRVHAQKVFQTQNPFDLIVSGHVHVVDDYTWVDKSSGRELRSINLGCWTREQSPCVFVLDDSGGNWVQV